MSRREWPRIRGRASGTLYQLRLACSTRDIRRGLRRSGRAISVGVARTLRSTLGRHPRPAYTSATKRDSSSAGCALPHFGRRRSGHCRPPTDRPRAISSTRGSLRRLLSGSPSPRSLLYRRAGSRALESLRIRCSDRAVYRAAAYGTCFSSPTSHGIRARRLFGPFTSSLRPTASLARHRRPAMHDGSLIAVQNASPPRGSLRSTRRRAHPVLSAERSIDVRPRTTPDRAVWA